MRIAIIGTEGAGKTTFLTMLSEYCRTDAPPHLHMRPATAGTTQYVAKQSEMLRRGAWPDPTLMHKDTMQNLVWTINVPGSEKTYELKSCDVSGQDIRAFILNDGHLKAAASHRQMMDYFANADVILGLVDFTEFEKRRHDAVALAELRFVAEAVLYGTGFMKKKERMLIATKADLLPEGQRTDVPSLFRKYLGGIGSTSFQNVSCAVVAVETTPQIVDGVAKRNPVTPLKCLGIRQVTEILSASILVCKRRQLIRRIQLISGLVAACCLILAVAGVYGLGLLAVVTAGVYCLRFRPLIGRLLLRLKP